MVSWRRQNLSFVVLGLAEGLAALVRSWLVECARRQGEFLVVFEAA